MRRKLAVLSLAILIALPALAQTGNAGTTAAPASSAAAAPSSAKVGVINIQRAILASNEGQRDFEALQKRFEPKQSELRTLNQEVEELQKQLNTQGEKLNEAARANLVKSIEQKKKSLQRSGEDAQTDFQNQQNEIVQRILQKLGPIVEKYARDNAYSLLLDGSSPWPQSPLLWAGQSIDITDEIVSVYNAQSGVPPPARTGAAPSAPSATRPAGTTTRPAGTTGTGTTPNRPAGSTTTPAKPVGTTNPPPTTPR